MTRVILFEIVIRQKPKQNIYIYCTSTVNCTLNIQETISNEMVSMFQLPLMLREIKSGLKLK